MLKRYTKDEYLNKLPQGLMDHIYLRLRSNLSNRLEWRRNPKRTKKIIGRYIRQIIKYLSLENKIVLELGCGKVNSLSVATALLMNGCSKVYSIESASSYDKLNFNDEAISSGLYEMILDCHVNKNEWLYTDSSKHFDKILMDIDMKKLNEGSWEKATNKLNIFLSDKCLEDLELSEGTIDIMVSQSVFEHIMDFHKVMKRIYYIMSDEGIMVHLVDFADHRAIFNPKKYNDWSFLCENDSYSDKMCNMLRSSEMIKIIEDYGFKCIEVFPKKRTIPKSIFNRFSNRYKSMKIDDLETISAVLVIKKDKTPV